MALQSFIFLALLLFQSSVGASTTIRSPSRHSHFSKRSQLKNNNSGPCLTASSNANGAHVVVGSCSAAGAQWTTPSSGSGQIHVFGDKCLDVTDGVNKNGQKLQIWTCTNGPNQKFALTNGQIQWKGTDKCVDLTDGATAAGTQLQIWQCANGNTNQKWSYPASTSTSSPVKNPGGSSSGSPQLFKTKLGLAYPDGDLSELLGLGAAKMFYNWTPKFNSITAALDSGITFLPQLWGWNQKDEFDQVAATSNAPLFLGFNEPNEHGQSNMSPQSGISLWKQSMKPLRDRGKKLCSPATSGNPNGLKWMSTFSSECGSDCDFDYVCVHWYDTTFEKFESWINDWRKLYPGKQILITEFAPQNFNGGAQPSSGQVWEFYQKAIPWAMSQGDIVGVFPYGFMRDLNINQNAKLLNSDGSPNALGKWILSQA